MPSRHAIRATLRFRRVQGRIASALAHDLRRFFTGQAHRVVARYRLGEAEFLPYEELVGLALVIEPRVRAMTLEGEALASELAGTHEFVEADPRLLAILAELVGRIRRIHDTTRQAAYDAIHYGEISGYSLEQIVRGVRKDKFKGLHETVKEKYEGREETIARTETAHAAQQGLLDRLAAAGITEVDVSDGPGCGWTFHDDPDKANGTRRPIGEALKYPIAHPNCVRVCTPVLEDRHVERPTRPVRVVGSARRVARR